MRFAAHLLAFPALLAFASAAPSDRLGTVAAASGHAAHAHLRAVESRTIEGREVAVSFDQAGDRWLYRRCVTGLCEGTWFDGRRRFTFGINGTPLPERDGTARERTLAAIASYVFTEPEFRVSGGTAEALGEHRWRVRAPEGEPLDAQLDARSAVIAVSDGEGRPVAAFGRSVRARGALFALDRTAPPLRADRVEALDDPLVAPAGPPVAFEAAGPVALDMTAGVPIVPCAIGGRPLRCLLDTGTTISALTLPLAETLGLEPHGELAITSFGGFATGVVAAGPLTVGGATFRGAQFAVVPARSFAAYDVLVGSDLLARVRLTVDVAAKRVTLGPPGSGAAAATLHFARALPRIDVAIGERRFDALLDTGDSATFSFGYAQYRLGPPYPIAGRRTAAGVIGADDVLEVDLPALDAGIVRVPALRAAVRRSQTDAHLGMGILARCRPFTVDFSSEAMQCGT